MASPRLGDAAAASAAAAWAARRSRAGESTSTTDGLTRRQNAARQLELWRRRWLLAAQRSRCRAPPHSSLTARPVIANYLWNAAAIAVAVAGLQRSDHCVDAPAVQSLSWRLSLAGVRLDGRTDICTRADTSVSVSFVLLSIVLDKVCLRNVFDPDTGRVTRAHQRRSLVSASRVVPQCEGR